MEDLSITEGTESINYLKTRYHMSDYDISNLVANDYNVLISAHQLLSTKKVCFYTDKENPRMFNLYSWTNFKDFPPEEKKWLDFLIDSVIVDWEGVNTLSFIVDELPAEWIRYHIVRI